MPLNSIVQNVLVLLQQVVSALFIIATIVFLIGVIRFIASAGNPEARAKTQGVLLWGIIGLAVMAAAWGIVQILINFFGIPPTSPPFIPPPRPETQSPTAPMEIRLSPPPAVQPPQPRY